MYGTFYSYKVQRHYRCDACRINFEIKDGDDIEGYKTASFHELQHILGDALIELRGINSVLHGQKDGEVGFEGLSIMLDEKFDKVISAIEDITLPSDE
jgi:hypothetical protein